MPALNYTGTRQAKAPDQHDHNVINAVGSRRNRTHVVLLMLLASVVGREHTYSMVIDGLPHALCT